MGRQKNSSDQLDGRIVCIKLENFLTYDKCEIIPGEQLNVILGPNGTGKSSIVCAICLGLGGHPSLLGRAKDIGDYVKHRKDQATIEIELFKYKGSNIIVKRIIKKGISGEKSSFKWYLDGKEVNQKTVMDAVGKMNIQMSNLCQFLPQDKVVEFAKMNPQQLLEATEKAVGPPGMYEDHMNLIELRARYNQVQHSKEEKEQAKDRIGQRNKLLERDVFRHKEREKYEETIEMLKKKKPWVEYETARLAFIDAKKDKLMIEKQMEEVRKRNAPMEKALKTSKEILAGADMKITELKDLGNLTIRKWKAMYDKLEREQDKVDEIRQEFSAVQKEEQVRLKRVDRLEKEVAAMKKDFESAPDPEELKPQVDGIGGSLREIQVNLNKLTKDCQEYQTEIVASKTQIQALKSRIRELENYENQRLENLRRIDKDAYDAVLWLRDNKDSFSGTVYEPIMTQINMKDVKESIYLESIISHNDMKAFVCQNRDDQHKFSNKTRDVLKINVNAVCPPLDAKDEYIPVNPLTSIKKFGFENYLTELYDAPKTVHQYLCENYRLYNIPVGGWQVETKSSQVIEGTKGISQFCSPDSIYSISQSRYSSAKSTSVKPLKKNPNLLNTFVDIEQKKRLDGELEEAQNTYKLYTTKYQQAKKEYDVLLKEQEILREKRKNIITQMKRRQVIATQIETKEKRLSDEKNERPDIKAAEKRASEKISKINEKSVNLAREYKDLVKKGIDVGKERLEMSIRQAQYRVDVAKSEEDFRKSNESLKTLEESHVKIRRKCEELKSEAKELVKIAKEKTGRSSDGELIPEALREVFEGLPNTVEEIEALINEEQARLDCQYKTNPKVIHDYETNRREMQNLENQVETQTNELEEMENRISELLERWLMPLESLLKRINEQYCEFFRRMGCAGQVSLQKDPDDDYKKFGVEIQVKFRSVDKLKALTSTFQSGGERSVSTMLYLISLQELTKCPFRLVDEINQGMDPSNERRVFELVVETVCRPNTSQYFLITPKLLPDLHYTERMTILTILNGHWMVSYENFDLKEFIRRKRSQKDKPR